MASGNSNPKMTGAFQGTGAALEIKTVGFRPKVVTLLNKDDPATIVHTDTMGAGEAMVGTTTFAFITTEGVTLTDEGFNVGTDANINTAGELVHWIAEG